MVVERGASSPEEPEDIGEPGDDRFLPLSTVDIVSGWGDEKRKNAFHF